jgi:membrane-anchored protein YejM (alkaline phosphatase superfamily)
LQLLFPANMDRSSRKPLAYLAAAIAVSMALVYAFADDSDYRALMAARSQKLSDDIKFDPGLTSIV